MRGYLVGALAMVLGLLVPAAARADAPTLTSPPGITSDGSPYPGGVLTETPAVWAGAPTQVTIQWRHCQYGQPYQECALIPGATGRTYTLQESDVGLYLMVDEVATN